VYPDYRQPGDLTVHAEIEVVCRPGTDKRVWVVFTALARRQVIVSLPAGGARETGIWQALRAKTA
jgi:hypothetical protein